MRAPPDVFSELRLRDDEVNPLRSRESFQTLLSSPPRCLSRRRTDIEGTRSFVTELEGAVVLPAPFRLQCEEWESFVDISRHVRVDIKFKTPYL